MLPQFHTKIVAVRILISKTVLLIFLEATHLLTTQLYKKFCCKVLLEASAYSYNKGTVSRNFLLLIFSMNQFPPRPRESHQDRLKFSKIRGDIRSSRLTTGVADTGGKWKIFINFVGTPLDSRVNIYINFFFKFTLR